MEGKGWKFPDCLNENRATGPSSDRSSPISVPYEAMNGYHFDGKSGYDGMAVSIYIVSNKKDEDF